MSYPDYEQRIWALDIDTYERMRSFLSSSSEAIRDLAETRMNEIERKYPQHFKGRNHD